MLLLYILGDDWPIFMISRSNERLQHELEYTLLKPDCHSWWISKMPFGREDTLEEQYAIKFCFKLGKNATEVCPKDAQRRSERKILSWQQGDGRADQFRSRSSCDKSWIYCYEPETKRQSSQWKHAGSPRPKKARQSKSTQKLLMVLFFFYTTGMIYIH